MEGQAELPPRGRVAAPAPSGEAEPRPGGAPRNERPALLEAVRTVLGEVTRLTLPLDVPGAVQMRHERETVLGLLDGYLVSRIEQTDRLLLVVIGGPTGAGKSTLLNSLVGANVTQAGVLRPTTRTPVLLHHPSQAAAEAAQRLAQGLTTPRHRNSGNATVDLPVTGMQLVAHADVAPGLAILDSPDLDSWLVANRELAAALLGVADLWLFVTTGTDYADAVPWDLLRSAVARRVSVAAVLNRMRAEEVGAVRVDFARMLSDRGLKDSPVFVIPEVVLIDQRLPYQLVSSLQGWLSRQAGVDAVRAGYLGRAVEGTLDQVIVSVRRLVEAALDQVVADRRLRVDLDAVFALAREEIQVRAVNGSCSEALRESWLAVWEFPEASSTGGGRLRRRLSAALRPLDSPYAAAGAALRAAVAGLVAEVVGQALSQVAGRWSSHPAASSVGAAELAGLPVDLGRRADEAAVGWLDSIDVALPVYPERSRMDSRWRPLTLAVATLATGARAIEAGDPGAVARKVLLERGATMDVAAAVDHARRELCERLAGMVDQDKGRLAAVLDGAAVSAVRGAQLRKSLKSLEGLRAEALGAH
jgi:energy-coupling factor transporter ATP-binding protein EcfA2